MKFLQFYFKIDKHGRQIYPSKLFVTEEDKGDILLGKTC